MTDIAVIGGGIAGLTAAIYARRTGKTVTVLEKDCLGGQITYSPLVENYPGIAQMSGEELAEKLQDQAEALGAEIEYSEVLSIEQDEDGFLIHGDEDLHAKAVILAVGAAHRKLGLEGEDELTGCGISYCAVCDGAFYEGADVAIVGGGNTALQDALFLSNVCSSVTVIHRRDEFRGDASLVQRLKERANVRFCMSCIPTRLEAGDGELHGVALWNLKSETESILPVKALFVAVGQVPQTESFSGFIGTDKAGYLSAGENCESNIPGIFIAGDCRTKEIRQLTTAAADGAVAALAACRFIG